MKSAGTSYGFGSLLFTILGCVGVFSIGSGVGFLWARKKYTKPPVVVGNTNPDPAGCVNQRPNPRSNNPSRWHSMQVRFITLFHTHVENLSSILIEYRNNQFGQSGKWEKIGTVKYVKA